MSETQSIKVNETPKMVGVVVNFQYGGFGVSPTCVTKMREMGFCFESLEYPSSELQNERHNPLLVQAVRELGDEANGRYAYLEVLEIPESLLNYYWIADCSGKESIHFYWDSWLNDQLQLLSVSNMEEWKDNVKNILQAIQQLNS